MDEVSVFLRARAQVHRIDFIICNKFLINWGSVVTKYITKWDTAVASVSRSSCHLDVWHARNHVNKDSINRLKEMSLEAERHVAVVLKVPDRGSALLPHPHVSAIIRSRLCYAGGGERIRGMASPRWILFVCVILFVSLLILNCGLSSGLQIFFWMWSVACVCARLSEY